MPEQYRPLTRSEIKQLETQSCSSSDWSAVEVVPSFKAEYIRKVNFAGRIRIGNNVRIASVHNRIENYEIGDDVIIENVGLLTVAGKSSFGNGTRVVAVNEAGGREVPIYDNLSSQVAALLTLYRHRPALIEKLSALIDSHAASVSSDVGYIAPNASITNSDVILNVKIGPAAVINGASRLENGTINSSVKDPAFIGTDVIAKNFITSSGSRLDNGAVIHDCFVGQAVRIEDQFSAKDCLFFANCFAAHGEACSVFAGPYTATHHKSTLLIAGFFSFFNAGSGTNESNHLYKLGPVHQGILERGCKTGSNAYLLWPARVGAFSTVIGSHYVHFDTSSMPFSYLLEDNGRSILVPGTAIKSVGTLRDEYKWPSRDGRKDPHKFDLLIFDALSPYTVQNIISGRNQLENLQTALKGAAPESITWNNLTIKLPALAGGISYYDLAVARYLGEKIIARLGHQTLSSLTGLRDALISQIPIGRGRWLDLAGLIAPEEAIHKIITDTETQDIISLDSLAKSFKTLYDNYLFYEWCWTAVLLEDTLATNIDKIFPDDIIGVLNDYKSAVEKLNTMIIDDARKEFDDTAKIGYGPNAEVDIRNADFDAVRGKFEDNDVVKHIRKTTAEQILAADNLIAKLKNIRQS
jgi:hypothetical protein